MKIVIKIKNIFALIVFFFKYPGIRFTIYRNKNKFKNIGLEAKLGRIKFKNNVAYHVYDSGPLRIAHSIELCRLGYPIDLFLQDKINKENYKEYNAKRV